MVFTEHEDKNKMKILDGQQRLATLLLFLAALRDTLKQSTIEKAPEWIEEINKILYTRNIITLNKNPKLELNREDRVFFEKIIIHGVVANMKYSSHKLIKEAYEFLKDKINERLKNDGEMFVKGLLEVVMNKLLMIKILVDSDINANIIFETLNDRGLDLSVADLVKNYLFMISEEYLEIAITNWKEIIDQVGDHNVTRFLRHFWISSYELVRKEELYKKIKDNVNKKNVKEFLEQLCNEAIVYSNLNNPTHEFWGDIEIESLLEELNTLRVQQVFVLLLAIFQKFYKKEKNIFKRLLQNLINFTFRWGTICGLNPNDMERIYSDLAIKLRKNQIEPFDIIETLRKLSPPKEDFIRSFKEKTIRNNKLAKQPKTPTIFQSITFPKK